MTYVTMLDHRVGDRILHLQYGYCWVYRVEELGNGFRRLHLEYR
jgi:hypothetical protein